MYFLKFVFRKQSYDPWVCFFFLSTALSFIVAASFDLTANEAFYWAWSKQLDLSYLAHPPLQAWITAALTWAFGDHAWVVRLPALAGRVIGMAFLYRWACLRYGGQPALLGAVVLASSTLMVVASVIAFPDVVMFPFAAMTLYYSERRLLIPAALALGLAGLSKWFAVLLVPGVIYSFWGGRDTWLTVLKIGAIATIIQFPVLCWNYQHEWISFNVHLRTRHSGPPLTLIQLMKHLGNFIVFQIGISGFTVLLFTAFRRHFRVPTATDLASARALLFWTVPTMVLFAFSGANGEIRAYWTWWFFVPYFFFFAARLRLPYELLPRFRRLAWTFILLQYGLLAVFCFIPLGKPKNGTYRTLASDFFGWDDWQKQVISPRRLNSPTVAYIASDYHVGARIAWALRLQRMNQILIVGNENQFKFWPVDSSRFERAVFVADERYGPRPEMEKLCVKPLRWNDYVVKLGGTVLKRIRWALCDEIRNG